MTQNATSEDYPTDLFVRFVEDDKLRPLKDVIQDVIIQAIAFCDGNKTQAADELGIARSSLYRKVGAYKEYLSQKQET